MKEKKSEVITFRTTPEIKEYVEKIAEEKDWTVAQVVHKILLEKVKSGVPASPSGFPSDHA